MVGESKLGMIDAIRQALLGAHRRLGTLERCEAEILSHSMRRGTEPRYEITLGIRRRRAESAGGA
ncbi:MAG: hypothetical protein D6815_02625 [Candidatus Dadabacteria bacterium]|nr:MAG: hypothetical protein D6815_02625 [Candidatus Dadabacteria bacterium]